MLYKKVERVPPKRVVKIKRKQTSKKLSFLDIVNKAIIVIRFAKPNLAPGAKANG
ncbi:hypothetical protein TEHMS4_08550 [Tetragenococcus halophilus]|nr:hypothetical protein TEHMS4_08550 [Tetragenococcus halophilus]